MILRNGVGLKVNDDPIPLLLLLWLRRETIRDEMARTGSTPFPTGVQRAHPRRDCARASRRNSVGGCCSVK